MKFLPYLLPIVFCWFAYVGMPVLSMNFTSLYFFIGIYFLFTGLAFKHKRKLALIFFIPAITVFVIGLGIWILSHPIFRSTAYRDLLGEVKQGTFTSDISPVDITNIRVVDEETARRLGEKVLGQDAALGSRARLGEFAIQNIAGKLYWIAPLVHSGFFKWAAFDATPGYVRVSATNAEDVRLITDYQKKPISIRFQPEAFFGTNLHRHLYFSGYFSTGMTEYTFETDDDGRPFWVVSLFKNKIGFNGEDAYGVATIDPETGDIKEYGIADAPKWIDRIQPEDFIYEQVADWGNYVHGFWNWSNSDKLRPAKDVSLVYGDDHVSYWYLCLTSAGSDESTVGFMMVNTRTKESKLYHQSGATGVAAKHSAEGKLQEKGYKSTAPITYNVDGIPTYIAALKDKAGLVKQIAMINIANYSIVATGENSKEALREYKALLRSNGNVIAPGTKTNLLAISGRIARINQEINQGKSYYDFMLQKNDSLIFTMTSEISPEISLTQVGDSVQIGYMQTENAETEVSDFDNLAIQTHKSAKLKKVEEETKKIKDEKIVK